MSLSKKNKKISKKKTTKNTGPITSITQGSKPFKAIKGKTSLNFSSNIYQLDDCEFLHLCDDARDIDFTNNLLTAFHGDEYGLTKLKVLNLNHNLLRTCSFGGMGSLDTLIINDNQIKGLSGFDSLTKLQTLELRNNEIIDFSEFSKLRNLRTLDLSANGINYTPSEFIENVLKHLQGLPKLSSISFRLNPSEQNIPHFFHFIVHHLPQVKVIDLTEITKEDIIQAKLYKEAKIWEDDSPQIKKIKKKNENFKIKKVDLFSDVVSNNKSSSGSLDMSSLEDFLNQELSLEPTKVTNIIKKSSSSSGSDIDILLQGIVYDNSDSSVQKDDLFGLGSLNNMIDSLAEHSNKTKQILPTNLITGVPNSTRIKIATSSTSSESSSSNFEDMITGISENNNLRLGSLRVDKFDEMSRLLSEIGIDNSSGSEKVKKVRAQLESKPNEKIDTSLSEMSRLLESMSSDYIDRGAGQKPKGKYKKGNSSSDLDDLLNDLNALTSSTTVFVEKKDDSIDDIINDLNQLGSSKTRTKKSDSSSSSQTLDSMLTDLGSFKFSVGQKKSSSSSMDIDNMLNDLDSFAKSKRPNITTLEQKFKSSTSSGKEELNAVDMDNLINELGIEIKSKSTSSSSSATLNAPSGDFDFDNLLNDLGMGFKNSSSSDSGNAETTITVSTPAVSDPSFGDDLQELMNDLGVSSSKSSSSSDSVPMPTPTKTKKGKPEGVDFESLMNDLGLDSSSSHNSENLSIAIPISLTKSNAVATMEAVDVLDDLMNGLGLSFSEDKNLSSSSSDAVPIPTPTINHQGKTSTFLDSNFDFDELMNDLGMTDNEKSSSSSISHVIPMPTPTINPEGKLSNFDFDELMNGLELDSSNSSEKSSSGDFTNSHTSDDTTDLQTKHNRAVIKLERSLEDLGLSTDSSSGVIDLNVERRKPRKKSSGSSDDFELEKDLSALMHNTKDNMIDFSNLDLSVKTKSLDSLADEDFNIPTPSGSNTRKGYDSIGNVSDDSDDYIPMPGTQRKEVSVDIPLPSSSKEKKFTPMTRSSRNNDMGVNSNDDLLASLENTLSPNQGSGSSGPWNHNVKDINIQRSISEGVFGVSYIGTISDKIVRAKKLYIQLAQLDLVKREISNFLEMKHPNIVPLIGSKDKQYVIEPFIRGRNFYRFLEEESEITPQFKLLLARELAKTILFLHNQGVIHGSLKPANIIIDDDHKLWVMDYGFMFIKETLPTSSNEAEYLPPEFYSKSYGNKLDAYSFGIILYELFSGKKAFEGMTPYQIIQSTINGKRPEIPLGFPELLAKVVRSCWGDEDSRPNFVTIVRVLDLPDTKLLGDVINNTQTPIYKVREPVTVHSPKPLTYGLNDNDLRKIELLIDVLLQKLNSNSPPHEIRGIEAITELTNDPLIAELFNRSDDTLKAMLKPLSRTGSIGQFDTVERVLMSLNTIVNRKTMNIGLVRAGLITRMISILTSGYELPGQIAVYCIEILGEISNTNEEIKEEVSLSGGIFPLISLLETPNKFIQVAVANALANILDNERNLTNFKVAGGFVKMIQLFQTEKSEHVRNPLQVAICNFLGDSQSRIIADALDLFKLILKQMQSREPSKVEISLTCFAKYAKHNAISNETHKTVILKEMLNIMATSLKTAQSEYEITITRLAAEAITYFTNNYDSLVIARDLGVLSSTVQLLSNTSIDEVSIPCLNILLNFIQDDQSREALINLGIITNFVHLIDNPNPLVRGTAIHTLDMLLASSISVKPVLSSGIIDILISIVNFSRDEEEVLNCLNILERVSSEEILSRHICYSGGVTALSKRLNGHHHVISATLSIFLRISKDEIGRSVIVQEGIFPKFISLLRQVSSDDQGTITWILSNFGLSETDADVVVKYQVIRCCLALLRSDNQNVLLGSLRGLLAFSRFPMYVKSILQEDPALDSLKVLFEYPDQKIQTVSKTLVRNVLSQ